MHVHSPACFLPTRMHQRTRSAPRPSLTPRVPAAPPRVYLSASSPRASLRDQRSVRRRDAATRSTSSSRTRPVHALSYAAAAAAAAAAAIEGRGGTGAVRSRFPAISSCGANRKNRYKKPLSSAARERSRTKGKGKRKGRGRREEQGRGRGEGRGRGGRKEVNVGVHRPTQNTVHPQPTAPEPPTHHVENAIRLIKHQQL